MSMYNNEERILEEAQKFLAANPIQDETVNKEFSSLLKAYKNLLGDQKFITKISDRLQNKLSVINENIRAQKRKLEKTQEINIQQNEELQIAKENLEQQVQKRTEALEQAFEDLMSSNKELDTFVYRASHDLKGPIATLLGLCNVALMDIQDPTGIEYINMLVGTATQMDNMLLRLLAVNKLKNAAPTPIKFHLDAVIKHLNAYAKQLSGFEHITYNVKVPNNLQLFTDENIFLLLLENLLEYAIKTSIISPRHTSFIDFAVINEDENIQIYLSYNGTEIPESISSEIFELFHRTTNETGHSGIELYTVSQAAKKLHGNANLISSSPTETVFSVFLPKVKA